MAEHTAAEHTNRLVALRRLDSHDKARRVLAALDGTLGAGEPLTIAALARHAGVSRRFIYDHPELRAEAERRSAQAADRQAGAATASVRVTVASLRADLANAKTTNHGLHIELAALRRRLGQLLGQDALADLDHRQVDPSIASARLSGLEQSLFETAEELARRTEELDAARQINRELIGRLNRERR